MEWVAQHPHLNQESLSGFLVSHFRMGFEKWGGCSIGKLDFDHSNPSSVSGSHLGKDMPRIPLTGLKGFKGSQIHCSS